MGFHTHCSHFFLGFILAPGALALPVSYFALFALLTEHILFVCAIFCRTALSPRSMLFVLLICPALFSFLFLSFPYSAWIIALRSYTNSLLSCNNIFAMHNISFLSCACYYFFCCGSLFFFLPIAFYFLLL